MKNCWILATSANHLVILKYKTFIMTWMKKKYPVYSIDKNFSKDLNLLHVFKIVGVKPEKKYNKH